MFALRFRTALIRASAPLERRTATWRPSTTARATFSTTSPAQKPALNAVEEDNHEPTPDAGARIPLSIQANYYEPLRRTSTHGLPVCDLQLRSFSVRNLEFMCDFALRSAYFANLAASGPVPLPKKTERWTVPRSNFVHKKSQENFERVTHKRLIQIKDGNPETVELWLAFLKQHQFYGVGLKANVWGWDEIGVGKNMNVSLETLRDVPRPKFAHFGPRKSSETASKAQEILNSAEYKKLEPKTSAPVEETVVAEPIKAEEVVAEAAKVEEVAAVNEEEIVGEVVTAVETEASTLIAEAEPVVEKKAEKKPSTSS